MTELEKMKFYIVVPQAAINYVLNPTPYRATTGYTAVDGTIAISDTYTRRGPGCIKVTPTINASGIYYSAISVTDTQSYTFSVDVKGEAGKAMRIKVEDAGASYSYEQTFTATGNWQRIEVTFTAEETATDYRLYVLRDATTGTNPFWVDGFQFEDGSEATTFFSGDTQGFGIAPFEFYWGGTPHASISYRTADTRAGGKLLDIEDYAYEIIATVGLGLGSFNQIYTELASGGAYYQKHVRKPRNFSIIVQYAGSNPGDLHDNRNVLIEAIRPDYTGYEQPLIIRYQGENASGAEATQPIEIICIPQPSHESLPDNPLVNRDVLNFTVLDGYLQGAYIEGAELGLYDTLAVGDYLVYRDKNGLWHDVANGNYGIGGNVHVLAEAPNGDIYIGGHFINAGNVAEANFLCKWDGTAITAVVDGFNASVYALCFDTDGNLYIGGGFTNAGDANGNGIVKWDGNSLSSLGTGSDNNTVLAINIDPNTGNIYVGGSFSGMGGVANTAKIAYWDGSAWNAMATGLSDSVTTMQFGADGYLYIGGAFLNADGANGDYICYWDGIAFNMLGNTELNGIVNKILFNDAGNLIVGGHFTDAGNDANADYIAIFKNNEYGALCSEVLNNYVYNIIEFNNGLIICGSFNKVGDSSLADRVISYVNGAYQLVDISLPGVDVIFSLLIDKNKRLFIGGNYIGVTLGCDQKTIINSGNTNVHPTVEIKGPGVLQSITNYTTGKGITFDGLTLQAGEIITLSLNPVDIDMTSTWGGRGNLLKYINPGSDLGQFYLRPGTNYISLFMPSGTDANTKAFISYVPKFWNLEGSRYE